jgi:hypothetical protein
MPPPVDPTGGGMPSPARLQPNLSPNTTSPRGICYTDAFLMTLSPIARKSCILSAEACSTHGNSFPEPKSLTSATEAASVCLMEIGILTLCDELRQCDRRRRGHCGSPWRAAESSTPNVPRNHDGDPVTAQASASNSVTTSYTNSRDTILASLTIAVPTVRLVVALLTRIERLSGVSVGTRRYLTLMRRRCSSVLHIAADFVKIPLRRLENTACAAAPRARVRRESRVCRTTLGMAFVTR